MTYSKFNKQSLKWLFEFNYFKQLTNPAVKSVKSEMKRANFTPMKITSEFYVWSGEDNWQCGQFSMNLIRPIHVEVTQNPIPV